MPSEKFGLWLLEVMSDCSDFVEIEQNWKGDEKETATEIGKFQGAFGHRNSYNERWRSPKDAVAVTWWEWVQRQMKTGESSIHNPQCCSVTCKPSQKAPEVPKVEGFKEKC